MMSDTFRAGDEDFDFIRGRFYAMAERHLRDCPPTPSKAKGKKKRDKKAEAKPEQTEIDGRPVEIARTGAGEAINHAADALQWLIRKDHLRSPVPHHLPLNERDRLLTISHNEAVKRTDTAQKLASIFEKAAIAPLRSPDFEAVPGGTFGPRSISLTKLQCIGILAELGRDIPPACLQLLEAIICRNEFPWHAKAKAAAAGARNAKEAERMAKAVEQAAFAEIRMAIDFASWSLDKRHGRSEMTEDEIVRRWPAAQDWFTARRLAESALAFKMDRAPD